MPRAFGVNFVHLLGCSASTGVVDADKISILVVDDHEITRRGVAMTLGLVPGFQVIGEAADGEAAIGQAIRLRPDVILMDIGLPLLNGIDALKKIKEELPNVRTLMFTSHDDDNDIFASLAAGADGYCLKDISGEQLEIAIRTVFTGGGWLDPGIARRVLRMCKAVPPQSEAAAPGTRPHQFGLSPREVEVLGLVVDGMSNQEIANHLNLSDDTVKTHVRRILEKLRVSDRTEAAVKAIRHGMF